MYLSTNNSYLVLNLYLFEKSKKILLFFFEKNLKNIDKKGLELKTKNYIQKIYLNNLIIINT